MNRTQSLTDGKIGITVIGHMLVDERWNGTEHQHDFDELIYVMKGPITCQTATATQRLAKGQLLFVPKNTSHTITAPTPASFLYVGFDTNLIDLSGVYLRGLDATHHTVLTSLTEKLDEVAETVFAQTATFEECVPQVLAALLPALLVLGTPKSGREGKEMLSHRIKQSIQNSRYKPVRVEELAAGLYHTPQYVGNVFAAVNGMTVKEFEYQDKMQQAPQVLREENGSVAQAAARLGYDSPQYFSKCFKNYYGISPSVFVKQKQKG